MGKDTPCCDSEGKPKPDDLTQLVALVPLVLGSFGVWMLLVQKEF